MIGFSSDLHTGGKRVFAIEKKISNDCSMNFNNAISESILFYKEYEKQKESQIVSATNK